MSSEIHPLTDSSIDTTDEFAKPHRPKPYSFISFLGRTANYLTRLCAGRFNNPESFNNWHGLPGFIDAFRYIFLEKNKENIPDSEEERESAIPVHILTGDKFKSSNGSNLIASWLGHATVLVNMEGACFITDPIWSSRASIFNWIGPIRYRPPPMSINQLPQLDFGLISHDHYDHLDKKSVLLISKKYPDIHWFVPLEMKSWMMNIGIKKEKITEMDWGTSVKHSFRDKQYEIFCLPAQHWSQRGAFDRNERLWAGWAVVGPEKRFYYSGDTGFCDKEFKKIGDKLGPFDLSAIPIGAYEPRFFMKSQHINPEEAVQLHELIKSKFSIGIHWGTYRMGSYEDYLEPKQKLEKIMEEKKAKNPSTKSFVTIEMGKIWEDVEREENKTSF